MDLEHKCARNLRETSKDPDEEIVWVWAMVFRMPVASRGDATLQMSSGDGVDGGVTPQKEAPPGLPINQPAFESDEGTGMSAGIIARSTSVDVRTDTTEMLLAHKRRLAISHETWAMADKILACDLHVKHHMSRDGSKIILMVGAPYDICVDEAGQRRLLMRMRETKVRTTLGALPARSVGPCCMLGILKWRRWYRVTWTSTPI